MCTSGVQVSYVRYGYNHSNIYLALRSPLLRVKKYSITLPWRQDVFLPPRWQLYLSEGLRMLYRWHCVNRVCLVAARESNGTVHTTKQPRPALERSFEITVSFLAKDVNFDRLGLVEGLEGHDGLYKERLGIFEV